MSNGGTTSTYRIVLRQRLVSKIALHPAKRLRTSTCPGPGSCQGCSTTVVELRNSPATVWMTIFGYVRAMASGLPSG